MKASRLQRNSHNEPAGQSDLGSRPVLTRSRASTSFLMFGVCTVILIGRPQDYIPLLGLYKPALVSLIIAVVTIVFRRRIMPKRLWRSAETKLFFLLFLVMLIGIPFSSYRPLSLERVVFGYGFNVVYYVLFVTHVNTLDNLRRIILVLLASTLMHVLFQISTGEFISGRFRADTMNFDSNDLAFVLVSLLPFCVIVVLGSFRTWAKLVAFATVTLGVVVVLYTASRGGFLGLATFALLILILRVGTVSRGYRLVGFMLLASVVLTQLPKIDVDRYRTIGAIEGDYNATEFGRIGIWKRGLRGFVENPLVGVGVGGFGQMIGESRRRDGVQFRWQTAHNAFLQVSVETGIVGGAAFLLLIGASMRTFRRLSRSSGSGQFRLEVFGAVLVAGFAAQLVTAFFLSMAYSILFTLVFALSTALKQIAFVPGHDSLGVDRNRSRRLSTWAKSSERDATGWRALPEPSGLNRSTQQGG